MEQQVLQIQLVQTIPGTPETWPAGFQYNFKKGPLPLLMSEDGENFRPCPHTVGGDGLLAPVEPGSRGAWPQQIFFDVPGVRRALEQLPPRTGIGAMGGRPARITALHVDARDRIWACKGASVLVLNKMGTPVLEKRLKGLFFAAYLDPFGRMCCITAAHPEQGGRPLIRVYRCVGSQSASVSFPSPDFPVFSSESH